MSQPSPPADASLLLGLSLIAGGLLALALAATFGWLMVHPGPPGPPPENGLDGWRFDPAPRWLRWCAVGGVGLLGLALIALGVEVLARPAAARARLARLGATFGPSDWP